MMPQTIHIFSGNFVSRDKARQYSELEYPEQNNFQVSVISRPKCSFLNHLSLSHLNLNYIETIFGAKEISSYLNKYLIIQQDRELVRSLIPQTANTLVVITSDAFKGKKVNLISTPKLDYHGEFECYDDSVTYKNILQEQKQAKIDREKNKQQKEAREGFFAKCKRIYGDTSSRKWNEHSLAGFFQDFRTNPDALRELFWSLPQGGFVLNRLQDCFDASQNQPDRPYLLGGDGSKISDRQLIEIAIRLLNSFKKMGHCINDRKFVAALTPIPKIQLIKETESKSDSEYNYPETLELDINEIQHQWFATLKPSISEALWMKEGFYYLNCDYYLARYVSWHWYQHSSTIKDPYRDYYQLWRHGAKLRCIASDDVRLYRYKSVEKSV